MLAAPLSRHRRLHTGTGKDSTRKRVDCCIWKRNRRDRDRGRISKEPNPTRFRRRREVGNPIDRLWLLVGRELAFAVPFVRPFVRSRLHDVTFDIKRPNPWQNRWRIFFWVCCCCGMNESGMPIGKTVPSPSTQDGRSHPIRALPEPAWSGRTTTPHQDDTTKDSTMRLHKTSHK